MYEIRTLIPLPQRSELVRKYAVNAKIFGGIWRHLDQHLTQHFSFITPYENEKTHENLPAVQTPCQTSYLLRPRQYTYICDSLWRDLKSNTREKWITFPCTYKLKKNQRPLYTCNFCCDFYEEPSLETSKFSLYFQVVASLPTKACL